MKVAVCLSGFPRTIDYTFPYLEKYILKELNPDIFFCGYTDETANITEQKILDIYRPKKNIIRNYDKKIQEEIYAAAGLRSVKNDRLHPKHSVPGILSQYYNLKKSNLLKVEQEKEGNFKYDLVIRARTDYYFYRKISSEELDVRRGNVYIPNKWDFGGICDSFAYGTSADMDLYSSLFDNIKKYNESNLVPFHPETMMAFNIHHLKLNRIAVKPHFEWDLKNFAREGYKDSLIEGKDKAPSRTEFK